MKPMRRRTRRMLRALKDPPEGNAPRDWSVYILRCGGGTLYTGIAKDVEARLKTHRAGKGAAYTRTHLPVELLYRRDGFTRPEALRAEARIRALGRAGKEALIRTNGPVRNPLRTRARAQNGIY